MENPITTMDRPATATKFEVTAISEIFPISAHAVKYTGPCTTVVVMQVYPLVLDSRRGSS